MGKTVVVTGASGQDGSFLAEQLLRRGDRVLGIVRSNEDPPHGTEAYPLDLAESAAIEAFVRDVQPDEIYHLAADSFVPRSWEAPIAGAQINALAPLALLAAIERHSRPTRLLMASSSEIFGSSPGLKDEVAPHLPVSPYGASKSFATHVTRLYREQRGLFACSAILFNHESERRPEHFLSRKVCAAAARISLGHSTPLRLGNLEASRDWGYAPDYTRGMQMILAAIQPEDFVLATGIAHSVRELVDAAFAAVGLTLQWSGSGVGTKGMVDGRVAVEVDPVFFRPGDPPGTVGDASRASERLGWRPETSFGDLVRRMVRHELTMRKTGPGAPNPPSP